MNKKFYFIFLALCMAGSPVWAQKILLKINTVTPAAGEEVKAVELKTRKVCEFSAGGTSCNVTEFDDLVIKKENNISTNELWRKSLSPTGPGSIMGNLTLEYYNQANVLYHRIVLVNARISNFFWLSPECPNCIKMEHQVSFFFERIEMYDDLNGGAPVKWNRITSSFY